MRNSLSLLFLFLFVFSININSQVNQNWVARYNGPGNVNDQARSIAVDRTGNVYVAGWSMGIDTVEDYAIIKYNSSGVQQWVQRYNGPGNLEDVARSIAVDTVGNVYVTGWSEGNGTGTDYATIKYNSSGVQLWAARYNGPASAGDQGNAVVVDLSGNVYVTGWSYNVSNYDYATIKYNSLGVQQWAQRYNGPGNNTDWAYSIALDNSGNVYVTGRSEGSGTGQDYATIKYNSSGAQQWVQRYTGSGNNQDDSYSIAVDNSGNVFVTGVSYAGGTDYDYATIKYSTSGVQQWVRTYNGPGNTSDFSYSIALDNWGNVYVTGRSGGSGTSQDFTTIKYNTDGVQQWVSRYNGPANSNDDAESIAVDDSGNVYVTGESNGSGSGWDYATVKYNPAGVQQWVQRYNGPGNGFDDAFQVKVDGLGNVYVTGMSPGTGTGDDYATIKYSQLISVHSISNEIPKDYYLSQNYPNPFNPVTKITFSIPPLRGARPSRLGSDEGVTVHLVIYDILGRGVSTLINEQLSPGTYEVEWNASNYPSGVYYYRLETEDASAPHSIIFSQTKRMVLIK